MFADKTLQKKKVVAGMFLNKLKFKSFRDTVENLKTNARRDKFL